MKLTPLLPSEKQYRQKVLEQLKNNTQQSCFISPFYFANTDHGMMPRIIWFLDEKSIILLEIDDTSPVVDKVYGGRSNYDGLMNDNNFFARIEKEECIDFHSLEQLASLTNEQYIQFYEQEFGEQPSYSVEDELNGYIAYLNNHCTETQDFIKRHNTKKLHQHIEQSLKQKQKNIAKNKI